MIPSLAALSRCFIEQAASISSLSISGHTVFAGLCRFAPQKVQFTRRLSLAGRSSAGLAAAGLRNGQMTHELACRTCSRRTVPATAFSTQIGKVWIVHHLTTGSSCPGVGRVRQSRTLDCLRLPLGIVATTPEVRVEAVVPIHRSCSLVCADAARLRRSKTRPHRLTPSSKTPLERWEKLRHQSAFVVCSVGCRSKRNVGMSSRGSRLAFIARPWSNAAIAQRVLSELRPLGFRY